MKKFASKKFTGKVFFSLIVSAALFLSQTLYQMQDAFAAPASRSAAVLESGSEDFSANFDTLRPQPKVVDTAQTVSFAETVFADLPQQAQPYPFANPAGCAAASQPDDYTPEQMLANVQNAIGAEYNLAECRQTYVWNGHGFVKTGTTGFDVFRWNWITYHNNGQAMSYTVRWGDTIETIAFDWKVSLESIMAVNNSLLMFNLPPGRSSYCLHPLNRKIFYRAYG